jgi:hypothetical protein
MLIPDSAALHPGYPLGVVAWRVSWLCRSRYSGNFSRIVPAMRSGRLYVQTHR